MTCIEDIKCWMSNNFVRSDNEKTDVIIFGPSKTKNCMDSYLNNLTPSVKLHAKKNVGVSFDQS